MPRASVATPVTHSLPGPSRNKRTAAGASKGSNHSSRHHTDKAATVAQPRRVVRRVPSFWIYGLLIILAVYTAVTCVRQESELQTLRRARAEIQQRMDRETRINEQLSEQKLEIASGDAIERLAREKLGYVKDGERIFVDANK